MPADHDRHGLAQRAIGDRLAGVSDFGVEALRIADGEFEIAALRRGDEFVGLEQFHGDRLFQEHVLAGAQTVAGDRKVGVFRRGADIDDGDVRIGEDVAVIQRRGRRMGQRRDLGEPVRPDFADMQLAAQRRARQRLGADASAPAGADDGGFKQVHVRSLSMASLVLYLPLEGPWRGEVGRAAAGRGGKPSGQ
jgi:hypothetical protein